LITLTPSPVELQSLQNIKSKEPNLSSPFPKKEKEMQELKANLL